MLHDKHPMRTICLISSEHPPFDKRVFDKEAMAMVQAGYRVVHLCPSQRQERFERDGVILQTFPKRHGLWQRLGNLALLYRMARAERADIHYCNEVDSWLVGVVLRLVTGKPCVFDVHEHYPSTYAESRFPAWARPLAAAAVRLAFACFTPFTAALVLAKKSVATDFPGTQKKQALVRNFTPLFAIQFATMARTPKIVGAPLTIVHLGLFSRLRGWPQTLEALAQAKHQNLHLHVIGEINDGSAAQFEAEVVRLGVSDRVRYTPWLPFAEAFRILCESDIGLIAFQPGVQNHIYAMPHKMFDYMTAGCAVLCPAFAAEVAPVIEESRCGLLIQPGDPASIAAAFDALAADPAQIVAMGARGQQAVKERYNWEAEAATLLAKLQELTR